ncbi:Serine/threonine-protein kinase PrkC [Novipirellula aureliae]|uniref:Serine/threonine-protein kinase PrkC n=1 Tax=Novipirellula aureliae TaxID=2527966 RepID=A0A5C6DLJ1_9BACT|nr:hypothetical protein [Novipirellula aureliae]TWU37472.1 Serine/threonine-protein kinase PrkC [Novipirellula aureliae]
MSDQQPGVSAPEENPIDDPFSSLHTQRAQISASSEDSGSVADFGVEQIGDYKIVRELGRGGMGIVYLAKQRTLDRLVALKVISLGQLSGGEEIARFHAEAESAARLDHRNIATVYEVGVVEELGSASGFGIQMRPKDEIDGR